MKNLETTSVILILIFGIFIACESPTDSVPESMSHAELNAVTSNSSNVPSIATNKAEKNLGLATFRRATAQYHNIDAAIEDGFVQALPCQENPDGEGGLGIPYINPDRLDAIIDPTEPEVLFYEPQKNGRLRLVGVEAVVPIELWDESENDLPSLFGRDFHRNEEHGLYGLHIWIWKHNPDGVLAFWHSDVFCEFAVE